MDGWIDGRTELRLPRPR